MAIIIVVLILLLYIKPILVQTSTKNKGFDKRITSSLVFKNITHGRDGAIFSCRMTNSSKITGLVTAVERSISITVDCECSFKYAITNAQYFQYLTINSSSICLSNIFSIKV